MNKFIQELPAFLVIGVAIAFTAALFILFFYVLMWGAIIGGIIWLVFVVKNYFFPKKPPSQHKGRIIDQK